LVVGGHISGKSKFYKVFFVDFNAYFVCSVFLGSAEADVG